VISDYQVGIDHIAINATSTQTADLHIGASSIGGTLITYNSGACPDRIDGRRSGAIHRCRRRSLSRARSHVPTRVSERCERQITAKTAVAAVRAGLPLSANGFSTSTGL
jgi:hypothetical protein